MPYYFFAALKGVHFLQTSTAGDSATLGNRWVCFLPRATALVQLPCFAKHGLALLQRFLFHPSSELVLSLFFPYIAAHCGTKGGQDTCAGMDGSCAVQLDGYFVQVNTPIILFCTFLHSLQRSSGLWASWPGREARKTMHMTFAYTRCEYSTVGSVIESGMYVFITSRPSSSPAIYACDCGRSVHIIMVHVDRETVRFLYCVGFFHPFSQVNSHNTTPSFLRRSRV